MPFMNWDQYYNSILNQSKIGSPCGFIQWKGTDVCVDLYCVCGHHGHVDTDFFYNYKCVKCGQRYAVGAYIKLVPLTDDEAEYVEVERNGFTTEGE